MNRFILLLFIIKLSIAFQWNNVHLPRFHTSYTARNIFGKKNNDAIREEQYRLQQEMLARRKNPKKMREYYEDVEKRRVNAATESKITQFAKSSDKVDPIEAWRKAKEQGKIAEIGYEPEPSKESSLFGVNIILPVNPIGIPKYDAGERFDLRLPYAERGYEDESADIMGKIGKAFSSIFGGKPSEKQSKEPKDDIGEAKANKKKK
jgi:hypothetical protein